VGAEAFAVIRETISKEGMVAVGKVVFTSREHIIALEARGKGLVGITLRCPYEVRKEKEYFDDIPAPKITKDMLELATHIIETKTAEFDPKKFEDQYEDAVKELLRKKQAGERIESSASPQTSLTSWRLWGAASRRRVAPRGKSQLAQCSSVRPGKRRRTRRTLLSGERANWDSSFSPPRRTLKHVLAEVARD
jgi:DNA end-binding protein Ku